MKARLRLFSKADIVAAHALTAQFGWPHRLEDWDLMARHGRGATLKWDEALIGMGMVWQFGPGHTALGLVGVHPAEQGKGLGRQLMQLLLDGTAGRTVILHATEAGAPLYRSLGFEADGSIRQYQGVVHNDGLVRLPEGQRLRAIGRNDHAAVAALDEAALGFPRGGLLAELLDVPGGVLLDVDGAPAGFALQRRFGRGQLIGPAVARDRVGAQALIGHLLGQLAGQFVRIDVPDEGGLGPWLGGFGLADAGPGLRMVRGPKPATGQGGVRMQAMMSQALG